MDSNADLQQGYGKSARERKRAQECRLTVEVAVTKKPRQELTISKDSLTETPVNAKAGLVHLTQTRFDEFKISPLSIKALHAVLKYETMTAVQEATFPVILQGLEVMAKARTGTGKTIAFLLPAIELILKECRSAPNQILSVIVSPTRELAQQIAAEAKLLLTFHEHLRCQVVYGGTNICREQTELSSSPCQILVGTPGRLVDHIENTAGMAMRLTNVKLFVLDEADRMLDMGFRVSLDKIIQALPSQRQTLLFSATIPREVHTMALHALRPGYKFIDTVGTDSQDTHAEVKQEYVIVPLENQFEVVHSILEKHIQKEANYKVLVFCVTARVTAFMFILFTNLGFNSREIHSRKNQSQRNRVSEEFRQCKGGIILFTSDVSARGIDYPDVSLVIQVGVPSDADQYIHRLGRTGRAGKGGEGLLVLAPWEKYFLDKLQNIPISQLPDPLSNMQQKNRIISVCSQIDERVRTMAYQAWIGYYNSLKGLKLSKMELIDYANQFSFSTGFRKPPAVKKNIASKMGLVGVPGLRITG